MLSILKNQNGMTITGQGGKIAIFVTPFLFAAVFLHLNFPALAALPVGLGFVRPIGWLWLVPGLALWATAVVQLLRYFPKGKIVTTGAYGLVRNPIYASVTLFVLPATALITLTWVYLAAAVFMYIGITLFIGQEEEQLKRVFGKEYEDYLGRVRRLIPIKV